MFVFRIALTAAVFAGFCQNLQGQETGEHQIDVLVEALAHPDFSIRKNARLRLNNAGALATNQDPERKLFGELAVRRLVDVLRNGEMDRAVGAAGALVEIGIDAKGVARPVLTEILTSTQTENWRWSVAANVIAVVDPDRTGLFQLFIERLKSDNPLVQLASIQAVRAIAPAAKDTQPELLAEARLGLLDLLARERPPLTEILLRQTSSASAGIAFRGETRWLDDFTIIDVLMVAGIDQDELCRLLSERARADVSDHIQVAAAQRLLRNGPEGAELAAEILAGLLADPFCRVRSVAIDLSEKLGPSGLAVAPHLVPLLESDDEDFRENAAKALGNMGPAAEATLPYLTRALEFEKLRGRSGERVVETFNSAIARISAEKAAPAAE